MAKTVSWVAGVVLVVAGVWGFFATPVAGFLGANAVSSVIHVVAGVLLVAMASKPSAGMTLKVVGIVYIVWGILGMLGMGAWSAAADAGTNWFYVVVGVVLAVVGFMTKRGMAAPVTPQM